MPIHLKGFNVYEYMCLCIQHQHMLSHFLFCFRLKFSSRALKLSSDFFFLPLFKHIDSRVIPGNLDEQIKSECGWQISTAHLIT